MTHCQHNLCDIKSSDCLTGNVKDCVMNDYCGEYCGHNFWKGSRACPAKDFGQNAQWRQTMMGEITGETGKFLPPFHPAAPDQDS